MSSGAVLTDGKSRFSGCGIYLQSTNDTVVTSNRIVNSNSDHGQPFTSGAVPTAIGLSGYGIAIISSNMIERCHHEIANIQTTATPRRGDTTILANNIVRKCRGGRASGWPMALLTGPQ